MNDSGRHLVPRTRDVLLAQLDAVGLALRRPATAAGVLLGVVTLLAASRLGTAGPIQFHPEHQMLPAVLGLLFPIGVWIGGKPFADSFLWMLPVARPRHALIKVFAGWVWLMVAVALFVLWLLLLTLISGGSFAAEESLLVHRTSDVLPFPVDPGAVRHVAWTPSRWLWLVPFTAATGAYLLTSALVLGLRHPLRWVLGTVFGLLLVLGVGDFTNTEWITRAVLDSAHSTLTGPYGLDALFTARTESLKIDTRLATGESVVVWRALPDYAQWGTATLLWILAGLTVVGAAAFRHRETRPG